MIILFLAVIIISFSFLSSLFSAQDERHRKEVEESKRKAELYDALKRQGRMRY